MYLGKFKYTEIDELALKEILRYNTDRTVSTLVRYDICDEVWKVVSREVWNAIYTTVNNVTKKRKKFKK